MQEQSLQGKLPNSVKILFEEHHIKGDGNCGFTGLGKDRTEVVNQLLLLSEDPESRSFLSEEILSLTSKEFTLSDERWSSLNHEKSSWETKLLNSTSNIKSTFSNQKIENLTRESLVAWLCKYHPESPQTKELIELRTNLVKAEKALKEYAAESKLFKAYVETLRNREWLGHKSALLYAKSVDMSLYIWRKKDEKSQKLFLIDYYDAGLLAKNIIHLLHTDKFTHYNLLSETNTASLNHKNAEQSSLKPSAEKSTISENSSSNAIFDEEELVSEKVLPIPSVPYIDKYIENFRDPSKERNFAFLKHLRNETLFKQQKEIAENGLQAFEKTLPKSKNFLGKFHREDFFKNYELALLPESKEARLENNKVYLFLVRQENKPRLLYKLVTFDEEFEIKLADINNDKLFLSRLVSAVESGTLKNISNIDKSRVLMVTAIKGHTRNATSFCQQVTDIVKVAEILLEFEKSHMTYIKKSGTDSEILAKDLAVWEQCHYEIFCIKHFCVKTVSKGSPDDSELKKFIGELIKYHTKKQAEVKTKAKSDVGKVSWAFNFLLTELMKLYVLVKEDKKKEEEKNTAEVDQSLIPDYIKRFFYRYVGENRRYILPLYNAALFSEQKWMGGQYLQGGVVAPPERGFLAKFHQGDFLKKVEKNAFCREVHKAILDFEREYMPHERPSDPAESSKWERRHYELFCMKYLCVKVAALPDHIKLREFVNEFIINTPKSGIWRTDRLVEQLRQICANCDSGNIKLRRSIIIHDEGKKSKEIVLLSVENEVLQAELTELKHKREERDKVHQERQKVLFNYVEAVTNQLDKYRGTFFKDSPDDNQAMGEAIKQLQELANPIKNSNKSHTNSYT